MLPIPKFGKDITLISSVKQGSGVDYYELVVDNESSFSEPFIFDIITQNTSILTNLSHGQYFFKVRAVDRAGLQSDWAYGIVNVDKVPPKAPTLGTYEVDTFPANISWIPVCDDLSGVDHYIVEFQRDNDTLSFITSNSYIVLPPYFNGSYTMRVAAVDKAGNIGNFTETTFTAISPSQNSPPWIVKLAPVNNTTVKTNTIIGVSAEDDEDDEIYWDLLIGKSPDTLEHAVRGLNVTTTLRIELYFPLFSANVCNVCSPPSSSLQTEKLRLEANTTYYWKVVVRDSHSAQVESEVMSFRTPRPPAAEISIPDVKQYELAWLTSQSFSYEGEVRNQTWMFEDGHVAVGDNVFHVFNSSEYSMITLYVDDDHTYSLAVEFVDVQPNLDAVHVDDDGFEYPNPNYYDLNIAITNANDGDVIVLHTGNYTIDVNLKNITLVGDGEVNVKLGLTNQLRGSPATFYNINFLNSCWDTSNSKFINCKFEEVSTTSSKFYDCSIQSIYVSGSATLSNCELEEGIELSPYLTAYPEIRYCTVKAKPVYYLKDSSGFNLSFTGQAIIVNSSSFTVSGETSGIIYPLQIVESENFQVNLKVLGAETQLKVINSSDFNVDAFGDGEIVIDGLDEGLVSNGSINVDVNGTLTIHSGKNLSVSGHFNSDSIAVNIMHSEGVKVFNSIFEAPEAMDIPEAIDLALSSDCVVKNNIFNNLTVRLYNAANNTFTKNKGLNLSFDCGYYCKTRNNTFYLNSILRVVGLSSSMHNTWNSTKPLAYTYKGIEYINYLGNYWDDYKEKYPEAEEIDECGIWDTPYSINSDKDNYPLIEPFENYFAAPTPTPTPIFDTDAPSNPYPSIAGTHNGTIIPSHDINVSKLYTYPCPGTGGHTEYIRIYNESGTIAEANWTGYKGDWHNITFDKPVVLLAGETYNYTIRTGSYPQIHHNRTLAVPDGKITCTKFTDANGKIYYDWIPAIRLGE